MKILFRGYLITLGIVVVEAILAFILTYLPGIGRGMRVGPIEYDVF